MSSAERGGAQRERSEALRICVVGSGTRFLSGISVYTNRLANALATHHQVSVILMRQLLPARLYPGHARVGKQLDRLEYDPAVRVFDGIDWFWLPSMLRAIGFMLRQRPDMVILQWWTGTVFHSYLMLVLVARLLGARVIVEFHESLDTAEDRVPLAGGYVRIVAPAILRLSSGFAFHAQSEVTAVSERYRLPRRPSRVLPHGPHDHYVTAGEGVQRWREAPPEARNILFFGIIRPFKGLEDLVQAFEQLCDLSPDGYWLTVVGETWEAWTLPSELIAASRWRQRITFENRYVHDDEVAAIFEGADIVALPYRRSAISGPVHVAMGFGRPLVVTAVGGLAESVAGYGGAVLTDPGDVDALARAVERAGQMTDGPYPHPQTWDATLGAYDDLFAAIRGADR
ncbi:MAG: glycosyltransferase family 4 protein [Chloroflexota bacterium]